MATVTSYTAARMKAIEDNAIVSGVVDGDNLVLTRHNGTTVLAGVVKGATGPTGPQGIPGPLDFPVGTFLQGGWTVPPAGFLLMNGQTIVNGAITYSELASTFPGWQSGNNLIIPSAVGRVLRGDSTNFGALDGQNSHTLSQNNLPAHAHSIAHNHTFSHVHDDSHNHTYSQITADGTGLAGGTAFGGTVGQTSMKSASQTSPPVYGDTTSGTSNANTGPTGAGTPVDHTPAHIRVNTAVKY